jgi:protein involved in polysaccharide export with SLBB domain
MIKLLSGKITDGKVPCIHPRWALVSVLVVMTVTAGCQTDGFSTPPPPQDTTVVSAINVTNVSFPEVPPVSEVTNAPSAPEVIILRESDVLKISFPANANLNTTQPIRRDGMISMPLIGEVKAAGKTPKQLEAVLVDLYSTQLLSKEVTVEVVSSTFPVYITGSVL